MNHESQNSDNLETHPLPSASSGGEWDIDNLPNRLTLFRVVLIPVIIASLFLKDTGYLLGQNWSKELGYIAAWTFVLASVTDFFDGHIARKRKIVTVFGSFLDPIADKFLVVSSLIMLQGLNLIHPLMVIVLVLREMYITALRLLAQERGINVPAGNLGKYKTTFQMIGIPLLMADDAPFGIPMNLLGNIFIYLAAIFSLYSAFEYSLGTIKKMKIARMSKLKNKRT